jgi:hypothetical protein
MVSGRGHDRWRGALNKLRISCCWVDAPVTRAKLAAKNLCTVQERKYLRG